jgi:cysteine desulfurase family protein (TIGR01976 family)
MTVATKPNRVIASVEDIRAQFPALNRKEQGFPVAYFDGPGGTQVPSTVASAMTDYLFHHNANTHWAYPTSAETDALLDQSRAALADMLGATPGEIAFGANMTTLLFHVSRAIGRELNPGDEIVVTELDHHANIAPWQALARERGAVLRWVPMDTHTFTHASGAFEKAINARTKVVAVGAASNALGTITDLAPIVERARSVGARVIVDAVHYAPHALVDVRAIGCDFLFCSAYKFYGPHIGVMFGRHDAVAALDLPRLEPAPDWVPECLETGTQNHEGMVGAAAAVEFLASFCDDATLSRRERLVESFATLHRRGESLFERLWTGLSAIDGVTLYGVAPGNPRTPTLSFRVRGHQSEAVSRKLVKRGVYASHGDFYATTIIQRLGVAEEGVVRAGCSCYTNQEEIDRLIEGVSDIVAGAL